MQTAIFDWAILYKFNLVLTVIIFIIYLIFRRIAGPRIREQAEQGRLKDDSISKALSAINIILLVTAIAVVCVIWGFDFKGLLTLSASILAVTGVALFAGWSVLSNITSFFILLAHASFRRGNFIRIVDADNYVEGYISEINLFNTKLISEGREVIIYPNNLILARPTLINPRNRLGTMGKLPVIIDDKQDS
ncbi:MAG: small-conductance mechanosensitive channel [Oleiphilaceae bacterium]|jgi:small-conductance mechanosensitive channel